MPTGLKPVRRQLATGEVRLYWYHRATGKRLEHDPRTAAGLIEVARLDDKGKALKAAQEAAHGVHDAARGYPMTDSTFTREEIDLFRQWFDAVEDTQNPAAPYLEDADYALAGRIAEMLGTRAPKRRKPARPI